MKIKREVVTEKITIKVTYAELSSMFGFTVLNLEDYDYDVVRFNVKANNISGTFEFPLTSFVSMFVNDIEKGYSVAIDTDTYGYNIQVFIEIEN